MKQIIFGEYKSYDDLYLICTSKKIESPTIKTNKVSIEGGDGELDLTEVFGRVSYNNRTLSFDFSTIVHPSQFLNLYSAIQDALHGKKMNITLEDDPDYYYVGRVSVSDFSKEKSIGKIPIECDCEPYKYKKDVTIVSQAVNGETTITLANSKKRVVPTITTDAEMKLEYNGYSITHSAGHFILPTLELVEGENTVTVTGTGNISFEYREARL